MEKTHVISSVTPLIDTDWKWYWCKVRAKKKANDQYGQWRTYSVTEMKTLFKIESPEACKNLLNKECRVIYDLDFWN
jgi:hypothetical protein